MTPITFLMFSFVFLPESDRCLIAKYCSSCSSFQMVSWRGCMQRPTEKTRLEKLCAKQSFVYMLIQL